MSSPTPLTASDAPPTHTHDTNADTPNGATSATPTVSSPSPSAPIVVHFSSDPSSAASTGPAAPGHSASTHRHTTPHHNTTHIQHTHTHHAHEHTHHHEQRAHALSSHHSAISVSRARQRALQSTLRATLSQAISANEATEAELEGKLTTHKTIPIVNERKPSNETPPAAPSDVALSSAAESSGGSAPLKLQLQRENSEPTIPAPTQAVPSSQTPTPVASTPKTPAGMMVTPSAGPSRIHSHASFARVKSTKSPRTPILISPRASQLKFSPQGVLLTPLSSLEPKDTLSPNSKSALPLTSALTPSKSIANALTPSSSKPSAIGRSSHIPVSIMSPSHLRRPSFRDGPSPVGAMSKEKHLTLKVSAATSSVHHSTTHSKKKSHQRASSFSPNSPAASSHSPLVHLVVPGPSPGPGRVPLSRPNTTERRLTRATSRAQTMKPSEFAAAKAAAAEAAAAAYEDSSDSDDGDDPHRPVTPTVTFAAAPTNASASTPVGANSSNVTGVGVVESPQTLAALSQPLSLFTRYIDRDREELDRISSFEAQAAEVDVGGGATSVASPSGRPLKRRMPSISDVYQLMTQQVSDKHVDTVFDATNKDQTTTTPAATTSGGETTDTPVQTVSTPATRPYWSLGPRPRQRDAHGRFQLWGTGILYWFAIVLQLCSLWSDAWIEDSATQGAVQEKDFLQWLLVGFGVSFGMIGYIAFLIRAHGHTFAGNEYKIFSIICLVIQATCGTVAVAYWESDHQHTIDASDDALQLGTGYNFCRLSRAYLYVCLLLLFWQECAEYRSRIRARRLQESLITLRQLRFEAEQVDLYGIDTSSIPHAQKVLNEVTRLGLSAVSASRLLAAYRDGVLPSAASTETLISSLWLDKDYLSRGQRRLVWTSNVFFFFIFGGGMFYAELEGWNARAAIDFAIVSLTTIGYGNMAPRTDLGKIFMYIYFPMGFAVVGYTVQTWWKVVLFKLDHRVSYISAWASRKWQERQDKAEEERRLQEVRQRELEEKLKITLQVETSVGTEAASSRPEQRSQQASAISGSYSASGQSRSCTNEEDYTRSGPVHVDRSRSSRGDRHDPDVCGSMTASGATSADGRSRSHSRSRSSMRSHGGEPHSRRNSVDCGTQTPRAAAVAIVDVQEVQVVVDTQDAHGQATGPVPLFANPDTPPTDQHPTTAIAGDTPSVAVDGGALSVIVVSSSDADVVSPSQASVVTPSVSPPEVPLPTVPIIDEEMILPTINIKDDTGSDDEKEMTLPGERLQSVSRPPSPTPITAPQLPPPPPPLSKKAAATAKEDRKDRARKIKLLCALFFAFCWLLFSSAIFSHLEGWRFLDSIWMVYCTITTIGFGDFFPSKSETSAFFIWFIIFGLGSVTYILTLMTEMMVENAAQTQLLAAKHKAKMRAKRARQQAIEAAEAELIAQALEEEAEERDREFSLQDETIHEGDDEEVHIGTDEDPDREPVHDPEGLMIQPEQSTNVAPSPVPSPPPVTTPPPETITRSTSLSIQGRDSKEVVAAVVPPADLPSALDGPTPAPAPAEAAIPIAPPLTVVIPTAPPLAPPLIVAAKAPIAPPLTPSSRSGSVLRRPGNSILAPPPSALMECALAVDSCTQEMLEYAKHASSHLESSGTNIFDTTLLEKFHRAYVALLVAEEKRAKLQATQTTSAASRESKPPFARIGSTPMIDGGGTTPIVTEQRSKLLDQIKQFKLLALRKQRRGSKLFKSGAASDPVSPRKGIGRFGGFTPVQPSPAMPLILPEDSDGSSTSEDEEDADLDWSRDNNERFSKLIPEAPPLAPTLKLAASRSPSAAADLAADIARKHLLRSIRIDPPKLTTIVTPPTHSHKSPSPGIASPTPIASPVGVGSLSVPVKSHRSIHSSSHSRGDHKHHHHHRRRKVEYLAPHDGGEGPMEEDVAARYVIGSDAPNAPPIAPATSSQPPLSRHASALIGSSASVVGPSVSGAGASAVPVPAPFARRVDDPDLPAKKKALRHKLHWNSMDMFLDRNHEELRLPEQPTSPSATPAAAGTAALTPTETQPKPDPSSK